MLSILIGSLAFLERAMTLSLFSGAFVDDDMTTTTTTTMMMMMMMMMMKMKMKMKMMIMIKISHLFPCDSRCFHYQLYFLTQYPTFLH
jgi:hypothetical protein